MRNIRLRIARFFKNLNAQARLLKAEIALLTTKGEQHRLNVDAEAKARVKVAAAEAEARTAEIDAQARKDNASVIAEAKALRIRTEAELKRTRQTREVAASAEESSRETVRTRAESEITLSRAARIRAFLKLDRERLKSEQGRLREQLKSEQQRLDRTVAADAKLANKRVEAFKLRVKNEERRKNAAARDERRRLRRRNRAQMYARWRALFSAFVERNKQRAKNAAKASPSLVLFILAIAGAVLTIGQFLQVPAALRIAKYFGPYSLYATPVATLVLLALAVLSSKKQSAKVKEYYRKIKEYLKKKQDDEQKLESALVRKVTTIAMSVLLVLTALLILGHWPVLAGLTLWLALQSLAVRFSASKSKLTLPEVLRIRVPRLSALYATVFILYAYSTF